LVTETCHVTAAGEKLTTRVGGKERMNEEAELSTRSVVPRYEAKGT
jgi:hypothetical protein